MDVEVDVSDVLEYAILLDQVRNRVGAKVSAVHRKTALDVERDMKAIAPVDSGILKGSISTTTTGDGRSASVSSEIGPTVDYARWPETGTSRMAPRAYMRPTMDRHEDSYLEAIEKAVADGLPG